MDIKLGKGNKNGKEFKDFGVNKEYQGDMMTVAEWAEKAVRRQRGNNNWKYDQCPRTQDCIESGAYKTCLWALNCDVYKSREITKSGTPSDHAKIEGAPLGW